MTERTQRNMFLRVASSYGTVSIAALQVTTAVAPIELQLSERKYFYDNEDRKLARIQVQLSERKYFYDNEDRKLARIQAATTLSEWQNKWER
ncbi:hypothetical protein QE152_g25244 [Popillia japonica]|uniref:Uncharacterized protein n=1 Tax=Popillia japonica TaxID=7064 RepID=A0AAW1K150_POPJA